MADMCLGSATGSRPTATARATACPLAPSSVTRREPKLPKSPHSSAGPAPASSGHCCSSSPPRALGRSAATSIRSLPRRLSPSSRRPSAAPDQGQFDRAEDGPHGADRAVPGRKPERVTAPGLVLAEPHSLGCVGQRTAQTVEGVALPDRGEGEDVIRSGCRTHDPNCVAARPSRHRASDPVGRDE